MPRASLLVVVEHLRPRSNCALAVEPRVRRRRQCHYRADLRHRQLNYAGQDNASSSKCLGTGTVAVQIGTNSFASLNDLFLIVTPNQLSVYFTPASLNVPAGACASAGSTAANGGDICGALFLSKKGGSSFDSTSVPTTLSNIRPIICGTRACPAESHLSGASNFFERA